MQASDQKENNKEEKTKMKRNDDSIMISLFGT